MTYAGSRLVPDLEHPIFKQLDLPDPDEGALRLRQVSQLLAYSRLFHRREWRPSPVNRTSALISGR
jgi:hypothetical protein